MNAPQEEWTERVGRGFRDYTEDGDGGSAALALILLLLVAFFTAWAWFRRDKSGTRRLFQHLADANGLNRRERRLLWAVAERAGEEDPPVLFFRRDAFDEGAAGLDVEPELLDSLRRKVYDP